MVRHRVWQRQARSALLLSGACVLWLSCLSYLFLFYFTKVWSVRFLELLLYGFISVPKQRFVLAITTGFQLAVALLTLADFPARILSSANRSPARFLIMSGASFLSDMAIAVVGFAYPSYASYRALERNATVTELVSRLTCWSMVVFTTLVCSYGLDSLLGPWLPFYYFAKVAFIAWLALPQTLGAEFLLQSYVEPRLGLLWEGTRDRKVLSYTDFKEGKKEAEGVGYVR